MTVTVPTWRGDVKEAADLVEEVARVLGYDRITSTIPAGPLPEPQQASWFARQEVVRDIMAGAGLREIVTYPLTNRAAMLNILHDSTDAAPLLLGTADTTVATTTPVPAAKGKKGKQAASVAPTTAQPPMLSPDQLPMVTLANALSSKQDTLRLTLLVSLLETLAENIRQGAQTVQLFEVGRRYIPTAGLADGTDLPQERRSLGIIITGPVGDEWLGNQRTVDFYDLVGLLDGLCKSLHIAAPRLTPTQHPTFHPGRCALIALPTSSEADAPMHPAGIIGEVHPEVAKRYEVSRRAYALELDLERLFAAAPEQFHVQPISRYPALRRDIAVVVRREVAAEDVAAAIRAAGGALVQSVALFDVYEGAPIPAEQRSLAFTIVYQAADRTLSDTDGDAERAKVVALLGERFGARLRE